MTDNPDLSVFQLVYLMSMVAMVVLSVIKGFVFTKATLRASSNLHNIVFDKVLPNSGEPTGFTGSVKRTGFSPSAEVCRQRGRAATVRSKS